jgi:hypothetical protein
MGWLPVSHTERSLHALAAQTTQTLPQATIIPLDLHHHVPMHNQVS